MEPRKFFDQRSWAVENYKVFKTRRAFSAHETLVSKLNVFTDNSCYKKNSIDRDWIAQYANDDNSTDNNQP